MATPFTIPFDSALLAGEADGFGLPVVFLHAEMADRRMWRSQMDELAANGYHVISYDRRGFGETQSPDEAFNHLIDLEAVLDRLGVHAVVLVGASAGGALAIDFAIEYPERTVGLALIATSITGEETPELADEPAALSDARDYAAERQQWSTVNKIDAHLWLDGAESENGRVEGEARDLFLEMNGARLQKSRLTAEEDRDPAINNLSRVTAPALLIVGDLDLAHVVETHDALSEDFENAFAMVLEGTAHLPSLERPDLVNPMLLEFLDAVSGGD